MTIRVLSAALALAFLAVSPGAAVTFTKTHYPAGPSPRAAVAADFSRNGTLDLVVASSGDNQVWWREGLKATGGFGAARPSAAAAEPRALAVGDFNRDGRKDLAVACAGANVVSVLWGDGAGGFGTRTDVPVGSGPVSLVTADFNADGKTDIAVANLGSGTVSVLLGDGAGGFPTKLERAVGVSPSALIAADFNRDGRMDLAVANRTAGTISILAGRGDGSFDPRVDYPVGAGPAALAAGHFNADGVLDLAVANSSVGTVSILLGTADGNFAPKTDFPAGDGPAAIAAADFDGDGKTDLAVANTGASTVAVLLGDGNGSFRTGSVDPTQQQPVGLALLDHPGDGKPDLAVVNSAGNSVSFFLNSTTPWRSQPPLGRLLSSAGAAWGGLVGFDSDGTTLLNHTPNSFQCVGLTIGNYKDAHPSVSDNGKVAFQSNRDGFGYRIFVMNIDGTGLRQVTTAQGLPDWFNQQDWFPVISHDGTKVAFLRRTDPELGYDIYVVKADGTGLRQVTRFQTDAYGTRRSGIQSTAWNEDGTKLAFRGVRLNDGAWRQVLGVIHADGTGEQHLLAWPSLGWQSDAVDWSPDGRRILFTGDSVQDPNLYHLVDYPTMEGASIATATLGGPCSNAGCVRFSPDGQWLVYQTRTITGEYWPTFIRTDGTGRVARDQLAAVGGNTLYWGPTPAITEPNRMTLAPDPVYVWAGHDVALNARLMDAAGTVLLRSVAGWQIPGLSGSSPRVTPAGEVSAGAGLADWQLDAINADLKATTTVRVRNAPDFSLTMRHEGEFVAGTQRGFSLVVSNAAQSAPSPDPVTVADTLPAGLTYVSASGPGWSCAASGQTVTCTHAGPIDGGDSRTILLAVAVSAAAVPAVTNTARVSNVHDANSGNDTASDTALVVAAPSPLVIEAAVNAVTWAPGVSAGSWLAVRGSGLAEAARTWADAIVDGNLPTSLDGVRVNVNGRPALIYYVSPTQLNVLTPDDDSLGTVPVEVINRNGRAQSSAELRRFSPGFFAYEQEGGKYVIAQDLGWNLLAKAGLLGAQPTRGARPREMIVLYGAGFGPANPHQPAAAVVPAPAPLANSVRVTIGGVEAEVVWAGQIGPGLCQIVVSVPDVAPGDQPLIAEVGGASSPESARITIQP
ncbi:MAG: VCBS repeat-containing protein [Bryobacterales bacterium]|nr:VCBS repeat-containing protein [Bryobacterales bacterium]